MVHKDRPHFRAVAELADEATPIDVPVLMPPDKWVEMVFSEEDGVIYHGPVFRRLTHFGSDSSGAWYGKIVAASSAELIGDRRGGEFLLPAAALDACLYACGVYLWYLDKTAIFIPQAIDGLRLRRAARQGEACTVRLRFRGQEKNLGVFDFVLFGEDGSVILEVAGYQNINVTGERKWPA
jgi:hypothetical protein